MQEHTCVRESFVSAHVAGRAVVGAAAGFWEVCSGDVTGLPRPFKEILSLLHLSGDLAN